MNSCARSDPEFELRKKLLISLGGRDLIEEIEKNRLNIPLIAVSSENTKRIKMQKGQIRVTRGFFPGKIRGETRLKVHLEGCSNAL